MKKHFPLVSLCIEDAENFLGEDFYKYRGEDILSAMEHVALHIDSGEILTAAWEVVKERLDNES